MNHTIRQLNVDGEKIKLLPTNVYNITHLAYNDSGVYNCTIRLSGVYFRTTREVVVLKGKKLSTLYCLPFY